MYMKVTTTSRANDRNAYLINGLSLNRLLGIAILGTILILLCFQGKAIAESEDSEDVIYNTLGGDLTQELPVQVYKNADNIEYASELPSSVNLSTSKYFPPIRHQQGGSCTAWATTYYQFTYEVARLNNWDAKHDDSKVFSPKYIWNYLNGGKNEGIYKDSCYDMLKAQGSLRWIEFPQNDSSLSLDWYTGTTEAETTAALYRALTTRISSYDYKNFVSSNGDTPVITSNNDSDLAHIKTLLNGGHVLSISTDCFKWITKELSNGEFGIISGEGPNGAHALTVVGYDDNLFYDLNQNGTIEDFEKGAFLIANSWGIDATRHNNGYIWLMYDALNQTSNASNLNTDNRKLFIRNSQYWYIEVANYTPQLTAEVTVLQKYRNDFSISLGVSDYATSSQATQATFLNGLGGQLGFNGKSDPSYQSCTFVFDYADLYNGTDKVYWINVRDITEDNNANTMVLKIRWVNSSGTVIKETGLQTSLNGATGSYSSYIPITQITLSKTASSLSIGNSEILTAVVTPSNATNKTITWSSSNTSVATVNASGQVTAVGKGTAVITATATDGSGVSASCTYTVVKLVSSITLNKTSSTLRLGQSETLTATVLPTDASNRSVIWSSSNTSVVRVSTTGIVTYVGKGTATVTATAADGSGVKATCTYTITDDYGDTIATAYTVTLHSQTAGVIDVIGDLDYFKFTPSSSGTYIIYTTGSTDTKGYLYNASQTQLAYNDDAAISGNNFAFQYNLTAGTTYYIQVGAYGTGTGAYTLVITKGVYSASLASYNQDARRVQMQAEASTILTTLKVYIGSNTYTLTKPASGDLDTTIGNARFKVTFTTANNGLSTIWTINAKIPATAVGSTDTVYFSFSKGTITQVNSNTLTGLVAYASSMKTGVDPDSNLQALLNGMAQSGYTLTVRNWDDTLVNVTTSTLAATGMKIIKTNTTSGKIVEVYYVVLFGDVTGNGQMGDGIINSADGLVTLQYSTGKVNFGVMALLAADANHDGAVDSTDALIIQQAAVKKVTINQDYTLTEVPDECYFLDPVTF